MSTKCRAKNPATCAYHGSPLNFPIEALKREMRDNEIVLSSWGTRNELTKSGHPSIDHYNNVAFEATNKRPILKLRLEANNTEAVKTLEQEAEAIEQLAKQKEYLTAPQSRQGYALRDENMELFEQTVQEGYELRAKHHQLIASIKNAKMYDSFRTQFQSSIVELKSKQNQNLPEGIKNRAVIKTIDSHIFAHETSLLLASKEKEGLLPNAHWSSNEDNAKYEDLKTRILAHKTILYDLNQLKEEVDKNTFVPTRTLKEYLFLDF